MAFKLEGIENLFPIPLWRYRVDDHERLNAALLAEIAVRKKKDKDIANRNRRGWQSEHDLFDRTEPAHAELSALVRRLLPEGLPTPLPPIGEVIFRVMREVRSKRASEARSWRGEASRAPSRNSAPPLPLPHRPDASPL